MTTAAPFFGSTILAASQGREVCATILAYFDFLDMPYRVWRGHGDFFAGLQTWKGIGDFGDVGGLDQAINGTAPQVTLSLSGVTPTVAAAAKKSWTKARGRAVTIYLQFCSVDPFATLDDPCAIAILTMQGIELQASGPSTRTVIVHCENKFSARGVPVHGWLSDLDQQARFPGDRGLERIPILQNHVVTWPRA